VATGGQRNDTPPGSNEPQSAPQYGFGHNLSGELGRKLHPSEWSRRCIIIGAFALTGGALLIFGIVVTRLQPTDAMPWVVLVFNSLWSLVLAAAAFFFGKNQATNTDEPPAAGGSGIAEP
jgi:hypothetical protein